MRKYLLDLTVISNIRINSRCTLLKLKSTDGLPVIKPGQFVQVRVDGSSTAFLRRPFSVHFVDKQNNEIWLLIQIIGKGTERLSELKKNDVVNVLLPLGNGFTIPDKGQYTCLLVGGGVGIAPLLYLGQQLVENGHKTTFLIGARTKQDLYQLDLLAAYGSVFTTTEDGSAGEKGFVTNHSLLTSAYFSKLYVCGPKPMMKAVARYAIEKNMECEVSLENTMACGLGVCLCCVENTKSGNVCVCKDGPVFNVNKLLW